MSKSMLRWEIRKNSDPKFPFTCFKVGAGVDGQEREEQYDCYPDFAGALEEARYQNNRSIEMGFPDLVFPIFYNGEEITDE